MIVAAATEFAAHGFAKASVNVIAHNARVAKGSIFVYFDDKLELFCHIVAITADRVGDVMQRRSRELRWEEGFFDALTELLEAWTDYFGHHAQDRHLTIRTIFELDPSARARVTNVLDRSYVDFLRPLLIAARTQGWLRADADVDAFVSLLVLLLPRLAETELRRADPVFRAADGHAGDGSANADRAGIRRLVQVFEHAFAAEPARMAGPAGALLGGAHPSRR